MDKVKTGSAGIELKRLINWIAAVLLVLTLLLFAVLLRYGVISDTIFILDAVIYMITMILIIILLNWYNQGRYASQTRRSRNYMELLILQYSISGLGFGRAMAHMQVELPANLYGIVMTSNFLNCAIIYVYGTFSESYMQMTERQGRIFRMIHRTMALAYLLVFFSDPITGWIYQARTRSEMVYTYYSSFTPVYNMLWIAFIGTVIILFVPKRSTRWSLFSYFFSAVPFSIVYIYTNNFRTGVWLPSLMSFTSSLAFLIIFGNVYVERSRTVLQQQNLLQDRESELMQSRLNNMLLQINPHFLYNTLGSIKSLCMSDPEKAASLVQDFSEYLHNNYTDMTRQHMVPFRDELEHLKQYLVIEKVRFPNLRIEYDINAADFMIPSLSIQPLAENAVRHGIGLRRRNVGTIRISSWETEETNLIRVEDDGVGFDPEAVQEQDPTQHLGIANVRTRLRLLCGGDLTITSQKGVGTRCLITIPKEQRGVINIEGVEEI